MLDQMTNSLTIPFPVTATPRMPELAKALFHQIGEDPEREGLKRTPERFAKAMLELTRGYAMTAKDAVGEGIFASESRGPVSVCDVEFFSLCEHHVLPFWGKVSVAYLPSDKILGLSKIARIVEVFSRRLQVQERLTSEIGESIRGMVDARAVVVSIQAQHMCMMMRGVGKISSVTNTEFTWQADDVSSAEYSRLLAQLDKR